MDLTQNGVTVQGVQKNRLGYVTWSLLFIES